MPNRGARRVPELRIKNLGPVRKALAKAARTDEATAATVVDRYVELRPGLQDKLEAERHHLLTGRRGTGKSTLLFVLRHHLKEQGVSVLTIDMEKFNGRKYPDVLIEVLIELLSSIRPRWNPWFLGPKYKLRRRSRRLERVLQTMLSDPQALTHTLSRQQSRSRGASMDVAINAVYEEQRAKLSAKGLKERTEGRSESAQYEVLKIDRLKSLANDTSKLIGQIIQKSSNGSAVVFLDDYYFVPYDDQPFVLSYLHQVCKGTGIWLKVGGVGSRLKPYVDGNPPVGMEPSQDISEVALDVTLAEFNTAQRFLEAMLDGVIHPHVSTKDLFTEDARARMILACGGAVARDYITLTEGALDEAVERMSKGGDYTDESIVKIWAVDIQSAVKKQMNIKEKEAFQRDAGSDASALSNRWNDICDFVRSTDDLFILVPQADLEREPWGKEVQQLENLRLIHRIKDTIPNAKSWQGVKTMVFMIDLGQLPNVRLSKKIPQFWSSVADFNSLRRAAWVYTPDWRQDPTTALAPTANIASPPSVATSPAFEPNDSKTTEQ